MPTKEMEEARSLFIRRWGEMAACWGVSRTMAEIHALLYLATEALCTDDVMDQLSVSRGSASMNLRELVNWGLITRLHRRGDRKEYFEAETNAWTMFETIVRERRRREVQPIVETIEKCLEMTEPHGAPRKSDPNDDAESCRQRLTDILEFFELMNTLFNLMMKGGHHGVPTLLKRIGKILG